MLTCPVTLDLEVMSDLCEATCVISDLELQVLNGHTSDLFSVYELCTRSLAACIRLCFSYTTRDKDTMIP